MNTESRIRALCSRCAHYNGPHLSLAWENVCGWGEGGTLMTFERETLEFRFEGVAKKKKKKLYSYEYGEIMMIIYGRTCDRK